MVEANILFKLLPTFILAIYKEFEHNDLLFMHMVVAALHLTPLKRPKVDSDLRILMGNLGSQNDAITSCLRLISTSDHFPHPY